MPKSVERCIGRIPFSWIAGRSYRDVFSQGERVDRLTPSEIRNLQETKLGKMLRFVVDQVPAYKHLQSVVERHQPFDAIREFPVLNKSVLQENFQQYLPRDFERIPHYQCTTGGTSGNQLRLFLDNNSQSVETAFMHRQWSRVGYNTRSRKATFRGVAFPNLKPGVFWKHNAIYNELQFSPFHMHESSMNAYVDELASYRPSYLHGYPSAIDMLADFVLRHQLGDRIPPINAALLGSEGCTEKQRLRIEKAFNTRVFTWYGHTERVVMAGECESSSVYHHLPDYGILEILTEAGKDCLNDGERGEIVGTGLLNFSLPLIRYRTGDYATRRESRCECGRNWDRFSDVEGRWNQDMVVGKNGARISIAALNMHGDIFDKVIRYQYRQKQKGSCEIHVMAAPEFVQQDATELEKKYDEKAGGEVDFQVVVVDNIPLTERGKLKLLRSDLS